MSKLGALVRAGLRSNFGIAILYHRLFREKKDRWLVPLILFSSLGAFPLLFGLVYFIKEMYFTLQPIGQERAILAMGLLAGQIIVLIFGIYYVLSAFYFSQDLEMLIPLPLRPFEVLLSKFIVLMVNEYLTIAFIVMPFIVTFGVLDKGGLYYWLTSAIVYLALPVIPLVLVSGIIVAMMRCINMSRKKDILILVGGIALLAAAFGFQILTQRAQNGETDSQQIVALLTSPDGLLQRIGAGFPPSIWAAKAISAGFSTEGLTNLAGFLAVSLTLFTVMIVVAERFFYRGVIGIREIGGSRRLLTRSEMSRRMSSGRRPIFAIFMREFRIMNRTPVFLLNGVLIVVILPVFLILTTRTGAGPLAGNEQKLMTSGGPLSIILILAIFMIISGSLNGTASSTFSREGKEFWISRVIPVSPREQVAAKFIHSYLTASLGIVSALVVFAVFFPLKFADGAVACGLALVATALLTAVGMIIDLARPLLDWTNPQKAIKQNLNVLLAMFANAGILAAAFFGVKALIKAGVGSTIIICLLFAALTLLALLSYAALCSFADKRYGEIE